VRYKIYIILKNNSYQIHIDTDGTFEENTCNRGHAEELMRGFSQATYGWFVLADGALISIPEARMKDVHFAATPVEEE
jgi:hypothetical protein